MQDKLIGKKIVVRTWGILSNKRKQKRREQRQARKEIEDDWSLQFDYK